eukprot:5806644-Amphidinium_carterae.1
MGEHATAVAYADDVVLATPIADQGREDCDIQSQPGGPSARTTGRDMCFTATRTRTGAMWSPARAPTS